MSALERVPSDPGLVSLVERHHAEAFEAESVVPGVEVHRDADATWVVHPGSTWRNAAIMVRLSTASAAKRLDTMVRRYEVHGRGMAVWLSPLATPMNLPDLLTRRGLRCKKYFPAMIRTLSDGSASPPRVSPDVEVREVVDVRQFETTPHPGIGPVTTPLRRVAFERLSARLAAQNRRTRAYVAWRAKTAVGAVEMFLGSDAAGVHGLDVLPAHQGRGIGSALLEHVCLEAVRAGHERLVLLASAEGQRLYERRGFTEVGRLAYWYRSFQGRR